MSLSKSYEFLLKDISTLKRVGQKTKKKLKQIFKSHGFTIYIFLMYIVKSCQKCHH